MTQQATNQGGNGQGTPPRPTLAELELAYLDKMQALNRRQQVFVQEYLTQRTHAGAAISAGYSERTARQAGHQLLRRDDVKAAISAAQAFFHAQHCVDVRELSEGLMAHFLCDPAEFFVGSGDGMEIADLSTLTVQQRRCIKEISRNQNGGWKISWESKQGAAAQLTKLWGLDAPQRHEVTGAEGAPLVAEQATIVVNFTEPEAPVRQRRRQRSVSVEEAQVAPEDDPWEEEGGDDG